MINNVNQMLTALMGKNVKKPGSTDANIDAFQSLLAALMNQGMNFQVNNMPGLQGELQEHLADMTGANIGDMSTSDVFGINPALMRMLSGLKSGTGEVQTGNGDSLNGFDDLMNAFFNGKEQEPAENSIYSKAVEDLLSDLTQSKAVISQESAVNPIKTEESTIAGIAKENTTITQEIIDVLTDIKEKSAQSTVEKPEPKTPQEFKDIDRVKDFNAKGYKTLNDLRDVERKEGINLKAEVISRTPEKVKDKQFIVTRPEVIKILKGESTKTSNTTENLSFQNVNVEKTDTQDVLQKVMQKDELYTGLDSEEKKGEMLEFKQDAGIQNSDNRSFQRVQETAFETKQGAVNNKEDILNQVLDKVKLINGKDMSELHISLKPESLGEVSIKLVMEKGAMSARIIVENSQVKSLIDSSLPQIKESLKSQNIDVASMNVSINLGQGDLPQNQDFNFHRWNFNKKNSSRAGNSKDDEQVQIIRPIEIYTQNSGLNLLA